ncbi:MAG: 50S ribosomal protein L28, partial [Planctomycetota bacterium]
LAGEHPIPWCHTQAPTSGPDPLVFAETNVMPFECHFTGKKTSFGKQRTYRGQKITKGGFGLKPTGITRRTFKPNLQKVNAIVEENGVKKAKRVYVSAQAIRSGLVEKPLKRKYGYTRQQKEAQQG